jgi:coenzyme F420-reducing hydrogenase gamma subunit
VNEAMLDVMIWLGACAVLGGLNGIMRIMVLARRGRRAAHGTRARRLS